MNSLTTQSPTSLRRHTSAGQRASAGDSVSTRRSPATGIATFASNPFVPALFATPFASFVVVACVVVSQVSCTKPPPPVAPEPVAKPLPPVAVDGEWTWTADSTIDGVVRAETEHWTINGDPSQPTLLTASLLRTVTFQAQSGPPFVCNQAREFGLTTRFVFRGTRGPKDAQLEEVERTRLPSPCAPDGVIVPRVTIVLTPTRGGLVAKSGAKVQTLRAADVGPAGPTPKTLGVVGSWQWHATSETDERVVEVTELWTVERRDTELAGRIERHYIIRSKDGGSLGCAVASSATYTETFAITGHLEMRSVTIAETARDSAPHPCSRGERVHLDTATGLLFPSHIELHWRGNRRQVLKRVDPNAASAGTP